MRPAERTDTEERISLTVARLILQYLSDSSPDPLRLREVVRQSNVLPVFLDIGGCFAIRPSGEVISFEWDNETEIPVETCPRIRNLAFCQGSKKYPALQEFLPARPPEAVGCPYCGEKGDLPEPLDKVVCYCGGVGWLPPGVPVTYG
jgi:hypothetical protein